MTYEAIEIKADQNQKSTQNNEKIKGKMRENL